MCGWNDTDSFTSTTRPSSLDVQFVDYDGVRFHLSTPQVKTTLLLSMHIRCWPELEQYGALDILRREYGALLAPQPEPEYNVSLEIDLTAAPTDPGACYVSSLDSVDQTLTCNLAHLSTYYLSFTDLWGLVILRSCLPISRIRYVMLWVHEITYLRGPRFLGQIPLTLET